jgi:hypothetical protein
VLGGHIAHTHARTHVHRHVHRHTGTHTHTHTRTHTQKSSPRTASLTMQASSSQSAVHRTIKPTQSQIRLQGAYIAWPTRCCAPVAWGTNARDPPAPALAAAAHRAWLRAFPASLAQAPMPPRAEDCLGEGPYTRPRSAALVEVEIDFHKPAEIQTVWPITSCQSTAKRPTTQLPSQPTPPPKSRGEVFLWYCCPLFR